MKHTKGPWKIRWSRDGSGDVGITADDLPNVLAECFADIRADGERSTDEAAANARLIAAAPDMFAALDAFNLKEEWIVSGSADSLTLRVPLAVIQQAAAAIARARGDQS